MGLAATIGGGLFGQFALEPSLDEIATPVERDRMSAKAWNKYSWMKLAGHAAFAIPWFIGRGMLSGNEVSARARALTLAKDILVGASLVTGIASIVIGRTLSKKSREGRGPDQARGQGADNAEAPVLEKTVAAVGIANQLATIGVLAMTSLLAMEGSESMRFAAVTKKLP
ncbi:MAG TPA: hypothetical protein VMZ53_02445 [Kofleriaceae bacterium]|nr:hypothetical protein [Kofleriaceae bacterium]